MAMITEVGTYFAKGCGRCARFDTPACSALISAEGLARLRALALGAGLEEGAKWGHPVYMLRGRNVAIIGAFQRDFSLSFFYAALMRDPEGVLVNAGPNTQTAGVMRFADAAQVARMAPVIAAYLAEAKGYAEAGVLPEKRPVEAALPDELVEAMDADPELAEAFHALTPGRQRSYAILLSSAKTSATRIARIGKARGKILAGKGATER